jgi:hypothetical protein
MSDGQSEYDHLLSYFKHLVWLTGGALSVVVAAAGILFYSNLRDVREDAKQEATRVAARAANDSVRDAFNEKNVNDMILSAANEKVGRVTDKMIEQQLTSKLEPIQQRILLIGEVSEDETRMRLGFRSGLDDLKKILSNTGDPVVIRFGKSTLATTSAHFEERLQEGLKAAGRKPIEQLQSEIAAHGRTQPSVVSNLHDVVEIIRHDSDLDIVGMAFLGFRDLSATHVALFDVETVNSWCSQNQPKCESSTGSTH